MVMKSEPKYIIEQRERMDGAEWKRVDGYDTLAMVKEEDANWRKLDAHRYTYRYGRNSRYGNDYFIAIECTKEAVNKLVDDMMDAYTISRGEALNVLNLARSEERRVGKECRS